MSVKVRLRRWQRTGGLTLAVFAWSLYYCLSPEPSGLAFEYVLDLGCPRHTRDPILFGLLLMGIAAAARYWLSNGPGGQRNGFTTARILDSDRATRSLLSVASALVPPGVGAGGDF